MCYCSTSELVVAGFLLVCTACADSLDGVPSNDGELLFETDIVRLFRQHCWKCHNAGTMKGELNLQTLKGVFEGGESGEPAVVFGKPDKSKLLQQVRSGEMPSGEEVLTEEQIENIRRWIQAGARGQRGSGKLVSAAQRRAREVHFVLEMKCQLCHGRAKQEGELDLRTVAAMLKGGVSGPALIRGNAKDSLIFQRINDDQMPPRDVRYSLSCSPITTSELERIGRWIDEGAIEPPPFEVIHDDLQLVNDQDRQWWSFQALSSPSLPAAEKSDNIHNSIDAFLLSRLEQAGLQFSPPADRRTLIRRLNVDLAGVVPTSADIEAFIDDSRPNAYGRLVDRLLASPRYGERWAQHWLDAAGFAESEGGTDADRIWPLMYQYRDYVIRSMNRDKPYDQFVVEQLAGDELTNYAEIDRFTPEQRDCLIATGFLRTCMDPTTNPENNYLIDRYQVLADTVAVVSSSLMGITLGCARCHDHPYDPISQQDYYRFTAIFSPAYSPYEWVKPLERFVVLADKQEQQEINQFNAGINEQIASLDAQRTALLKSFSQKYLQQQLLLVSEVDREMVHTAFNVDEKHRNDEQKDIFAKYRLLLIPSAKQLVTTFPDYKNQKEDLEKQKESLKEKLQSMWSAQALTDMRSEPDPFFLLRRGEWNQRGPQVLPDVPVVLKSNLTEFLVQKPFTGARSSGRRLALAKWLIQPKHPLTTRVLVNRVWQHYFSNGIANTTDDFGKTGTLPTHPKLMDWLAVEFVRHDFSMKQLHRLIVTSRGYRQQSRVRDEAVDVDPENRLLWHVPLRRMDAETLRDSILAVTGQTDLTMFGPSVAVKRNDDGQITYGESGDSQRRSMYLLHRRSMPLTVLETFDAPRMSFNCIKRQQSTVVSQALLLLHGAFTETHAQSLADQVRTRAGTDPARQLEEAYLAVLGRPTTAVEKELGREFLTGQQARYQLVERGSKPSPDPPTDNSNALCEPELVDLCLILLNSAEFLYID